LTLVWKEAGGSGLAAPTRRGFGMQVLEEMLGYELEASVGLAFEPDGLRCRVAFPLIPRIGQVIEDPRFEEIGEPA
jgi:two-component sensor histidine kinase